MDKNHESFERNFKAEAFISQKFNQIAITDLCKLPADNPTLPRWFEEYKREELEKVQTMLNIFACKIYTNHMTELKKTQRRTLRKNINRLIEELENQYTHSDDNKNIPVMKIQELQTCTIDIN